MFINSVRKLHWGSCNDKKRQQYGSDDFYITSWLLLLGLTSHSSKISKLQSGTSTTIDGLLWKSRWPIERDPFEYGCQNIVLRAHRSLLRHFKQFHPINNHFASVIHSSLYLCLSQYSSDPLKHAIPSDHRRSPSIIVDHPDHRRITRITVGSPSDQPDHRRINRITVGSTGSPSDHRRITVGSPSGVDHRRVAILL